MGVQREDIAKGKTSELENIAIGTIQHETQKWGWKNEQNTNVLWDNFKQSNIYVIRVPRGGKEGTEKSLEEVMVETFPNRKTRTLGTINMKHHNCWKAVIKKNCQPKTISTKVVFRSKDEKLFSDVKKIY